MNRHARFRVEGRWTHLCQAWEVAAADTWTFDNGVFTATQVTFQDGRIWPSAELTFTRDVTRLRNPATGEVSEKPTDLTEKEFMTLLNHAR